MLKNTSDIKRVSPEALLAGLLADNDNESITSAQKLIGQAKSYGVDLKDYLRLAVDARLTEGDGKNRFLKTPDTFMNGYEATLAFLNLPVADDLDGGIRMQAAADTFQTFSGTRALFPLVIDDIVKWKYRQTNYETVAGMISQDRQINGTELLSTIVNDTAADYQFGRAIAEGGRIPIHSIRTTEQSVKIWKFGYGYKTSYEFQRRASLDILTPYAIRVQREIEHSKVAQAVSVLINGDGAYGAAPVVQAGSFDSVSGVTTVANKLNYKTLAAWLVARAQVGTPIDTVVGNWAMYLQWLFMFSVPTTNGASRTDAENLAAAGFETRGLPILQGDVNFHLASTMPNNQIVGYSVGDTLEQLTESGSQIAQSEQSILTQEVTYVRTENAGFHLSFGDTRSILDLTS
jgi:hypothetical protein